MGVSCSEIEENEIEIETATEIAETGTGIDGTAGVRAEAQAAKIRDPESGVDESLGHSQFAVFNGPTFSRIRGSGVVQPVTRRLCVFHDVVCVCAIDIVISRKK